MGDAITLLNELAKFYSDCTFIIGDIGSVIGSHSGPGTLALYFMGKKIYIYNIDKNILFNYT